MKFKLFYIMIPALIIECIAVVWFFGARLSSNIEEHADLSSYHIIELAEKRIKNHIRHTQDDIALLIDTVPIKQYISNKNITLAKMIQNDIYDYVHNLKKLKPEYKEIHIMDANGRQLFSYANDIFYDPIKQSPHLNRIYTANETLDKGFLVETLLGPRIIEYAPVRNDSGKSMGYVAISQDADVLYRISKELSADGKHQIVFMKENGTPLLAEHPTDGKIQINRTEDNLLENLSKPFAYGKIQVYLDNTHQQNKNDILIEQIVLAIIVITLLFTMTIAYLTSSVILSPFSKLEMFVHRLLNGDYEARLLDEPRNNVEALQNSIAKIVIGINETKEDILRLAYFDKLTGLNNKAHFLEQIERQMKMPSIETCTVWKASILNLKQINEANGHKIGDGVLRSLAIRLPASISKFCVRHNIDNDSINLARGDSGEFMISANIDRTQQTAEAFAQMLHEQLSYPVEIDGARFSLACSVGWSTEGDSAMDIYENADTALQEAKAKCVDIINFDEKLLNSIQRNKKMMNNIKKAVELNEFIFHYQPKCESFGDNFVSEFEALVRWPTQNGMISPSMFIPFAEEVGLIDEIDDYVMETVINDVAKMEDKGWQNFLVSFNISGKQISNPELYHTLRKYIKKADINPNHLQIEITEHSLICDIERSIESIKMIRNLGVKIALDDFGTGHSSLGYLKDLPIDTLKIDRVFIRDCNADEHKQVLLNHIISLGHELGLNIVAEGVETKEELDILQRFGCDLIQGYLFYKPLPIDSVLKTFQLNKKADTNDLD